MSIPRTALVCLSLVAACAGAEISEPPPVSFDEEPCDPATAITPCGENPGVVTPPVYFGSNDTGLRSAPGDPSPSAPGLWLGAGVAPETCFKDQNHSAADSDLDWLADSCEYQIAWAFAPRMLFGHTELCGDGEPYWAAKYFPGAGSVVRVAYLFSYYEDCGQKYYQFGLAFGGGHTGDSEFATVEVGFNPTTRHWEFRRMFLSAHHGECCYIDHSGWYTAGQTEFQYRALTHPTVHVSTGKHANYRSHASCDWEILDYNELCDNLFVAVRPPVIPSHNLGSRFNGVQCVPSEGKFAGNGRSECYYTLYPFHGWAPTSQWYGPDPTPYRNILQGDKFEQYGTDWGPGPAPPS